MKEDILEDYVENLIDGEDVNKGEALQCLERTGKSTANIEDLCRVCQEWKVCEIELATILPVSILDNIKTYMDCYCFVLKIELELNETDYIKLCSKCCKDLLDAYKFICQARAAEQKHFEESYSITEQEELEEIETKTLSDDNTYSSVLYISEDEEEEDEEEDCTIEIEIDELVEEYAEETEEYQENTQITSKLYQNHKLQNTTNLNCKVCNKKFKKREYLAQHIKRHNKVDTTYSCDYCDKKYKTKSSWTIHTRMHKGIGLQCEYCEKKFSCNHELTVHKRFHTGDFPYICDFCGRKFAVIAHLKQHVLRHKNMKVECQDCGKLFTAPKSLYEHYHVHTGHMPYPCIYCERGYPSTNKYKYHLRKTHDIEPTKEELQKSRSKCPQKSIEKPVIKWVQVSDNNDES